jgi:hypothetical protein
MTQNTRDIMAAEIREQTKTKAATIWGSMDNNAKTGVRFGMFPADVMRRAEAEGFDQHRLCCDLMDCASRDGGMRA